MRQFRAGLIQSLLSIRTIVAALGIGAYGLVHLAGIHPDPGINAWDALMSAMTDSTTVVVIGLIWWLTWLIPAIFAISQPEQLIRHGSFSRAVNTSLRSLLGSLTALVLLATMLLIGEGAKLGLSLAWSPAASRTLDGVPSAFSAAGFAHSFSTPIVAVLAALGYATAGFLLIAGVVLATAARGRARAACITAVVIVTWTLICSSSPITIPTPIDTSLTVSLGWALATPGGVTTAFAWWLLAGAWVLWSIRPARARLGIVPLAGRGTSFLVLLGVAAAGVLNAMNRAPMQGTGVASAFYAGPYGDIQSYLLVAVIPIGFATIFLSRIAETAEGSLIYQALRRGSFRNWLLSALSRELVWATLLAGSIGILVGTASLVQSRGLSPDDLTYLVTGTAGVLAATLLGSAVAALLIWTAASPPLTWPVAAGSALAIGYWFPPDAGWLNVFAPYGAPQDAFQPATPAIATMCAFVVAAATATAAALRAVPTNAEQIA